MKIITLVENTTQNPNCIAEHGLGIYIETEKHKLLLDAGSSDALLHNARELGIDLTQVDTLILSHGHYDHSGGILPFAQINPTAKIYMQRTALGDYYHGERYIGIDKRIGELPQVQLLDGNLKIDEELSIFTHVTGRRFWPKSNIGLTKRVATTSPQNTAAPQAISATSERPECDSTPLYCGEPYAKSLAESPTLSHVEFQDEFDHEQCLVITQNGKNTLLSGCAHNGILNLLDKYRELYHSLPDTVISGFHMMKKTGDHTHDEIAIITQTAKELNKLDIKFYTGHCTGQAAYDMMKPIMGEKLQQISTGVAIC